MVPFLIVGISVIAIIVFILKKETNHFKSKPFPKEWRAILLEKVFFYTILNVDQKKNV